jgi:hypothetical protein
VIWKQTSKEVLQSCVNQLIRQNQGLRTFGIIFHECDCGSIRNPAVDLDQLQMEARAGISLNFGPGNPPPSSPTQGTSWSRDEARFGLQGFVESGTFRIAETRLQGCSQNASRQPLGNLLDTSSTLVCVCDIPCRGCHSFQTPQGARQDYGMLERSPGPISARLQGRNHEQLA